MIKKLEELIGNTIVSTNDIITIPNNESSTFLISGTYFKKDDNKYYNYRQGTSDKPKIHEIIIYKEGFGKFIFSYDGLKFSTTKSGNKITIKDVIFFLLINN